MMPAQSERQTRVLRLPLAFLLKNFVKQFSFFVLQFWFFVLQFEVVLL